MDGRFVEDLERMPLIDNINVTNKNYKLCNFTGIPIQ